MIKRTIVFANDTSKEHNPGCQAVCRIIDELMTGGEGPAPIVQQRLPLGYWANPYKSMAATSQQCVEESLSVFPVGIQTTPPIDIAAWEKQRLKLVRKDPDLVAEFSPNNTLVVNGEGSIHHNFPRALALFALMKTAKAAGSKVVLLNCTLQAMDAALMREMAPMIDHLHVRGPLSKSYADAFGIESICSPDFAIAAVENQQRDPAVQPASGQVLVTAGVLTREWSLHAIFDALQLRGLTPTYYSIGDAGEDIIARQVCADRCVRFVDANEVPFDRLIGFLGGFEMAISGRHHINLFLMKAGVPFVPLPSNTWKIEETLKLCSYPVSIAYDTVQLGRVIDEVWADRNSLANVAEMAYQDSLAELRNYLRKFGGELSKPIKAKEQKRRWWAFFK